jgi:hypothetical protein
MFQLKKIKNSNVLNGFTNQQLVVKSSRRIDKETKMRE